jgi:hypothetical protein
MRGRARAAQERDRAAEAPDDDSDGDEDAQDKNAKTVTPLRWIRYNVQKRNRIFNYLHHAGKLAQEYLISWWCQIEWARLRYIRLNQVTLRAHNYNALHVAAQNGHDAADVGVPIEMPASFIGGDR